MYHNVLHVFHDVLLCLTIFYDVQRVAQRSAATDRLRDRDNAAGIGNNSPGGQGSAITAQGSAITLQKSAMMPQARRDRRYRRERDSMLNSVLNGDWSNSVPGRQIPEGFQDNHKAYYATEVTGHDPLSFLFVCSLVVLQQACHYKFTKEYWYIKRASSIQYGYRKLGNHARVFSQTLVHGNSKIELRQLNRLRKSCPVTSVTHDSPS